MIINILAVDDVEANLYSLESLLTENKLNTKKINIIKALSGEEALKIVLVQDIDLILLDIQMPGMNGFETAKFLKLNPKTKDIPIVFLTAAFKSDEFIKQGYEVGAIDYFTKPIEKYQFLNRINLYINLFEKTKNLEKAIVSIKEETEKSRRQEKQLIEQSRLAQMGEMISMIAHQWRQPLSAISTTTLDIEMKVELAIYDLNTQEGKEEFINYLYEKLGDISDFVQNLTLTINDFRNFYKTNKLSVSVELSVVIDKALNIIKALLDSANVEVIQEHNSKEKIEVYDSEMMQVILNILQNAQDNFKEKQIKNPQIKITTDKNIITIEDNGGGVPQEVIEKIFDPYFSTKDERNGTGLGLYMSKTIVENHHNGKLHVANINGGACFTIELNSCTSNIEI
ncbi:hybrid sensor histidine kinase/response regulator [Candidatus Sulfurimonas marisnigri]|uniref:histidine kinase n=1 Tax=Candidatus Sulfurimonas marisnigri TaxID=2740405 RepID=A0A7S7M2U1_9BACT|nr:hybrid sensor histidine kinase/response regulator [Candidatus Sulfurimonas marisnigri]QOY55264.1 hybrid sensor histidine kinase/response regulator [Candidatus Sulfurimonas marisnigri]